MCNFCEDEDIIFEDDEISCCSWGWGGETSLTIDEVDTLRKGMFIDTRGYLRLVDLDDCNCLESGQKVEIQFCPFCGTSMNKEN